MWTGSSLRNKGQDMCLLPSPRHFRSLIVAPLLAAILACPAVAQVSSDSTGPAGAPAQIGVKGGLTSSNPATSKTDSNTVDSNTVAPGTTNSTAAKVESEGSQPQSNPGPNKAGSAILINIDKAKQKMTVFFWMGYRNMSGRYQLVEQDIQLHREPIPPPR